MAPTIQDYYNANALIMALMICFGILASAGVYYALRAVDKKLGGSIGRFVDRVCDVIVKKLEKAL